MKNEQIDKRVDRIVAELRRKGIPINSCEDFERLHAIERRIDGRCPASFRSLVSRYTFPELEIGPLLMFSNLGKASNRDLQIAPFNDPIICSWTKANRLFQIGRSISRFYDPICFRLRPFDADAMQDPLYQFNHESILQEEQSIEAIETWESWMGLLEWSDCRVAD